MLIISGGNEVISLKPFSSLNGFSKNLRRHLKHHGPSKRTEEEAVPAVAAADTKSQTVEELIKNYFEGKTVPDLSLIHI